MYGQRQPYIDFIRGSLALPGVVVLWTGLWTFLDRHVAGGMSFWKELALAVLGAALMVWTRTLFSNAGMDSLDHRGSLAEMGSLLVEGRLNWGAKAAFYGRSMVAVAASVMFWDGVYTICNNHTWPNTPTYNAVCACVGGAGMIWVMTTSEDSRDDTDDGDDGGDVEVNRMEVVRTALGGRQRSGYRDELDPGARVGLYGKALFCNVCSVVFWKGVEEGIEAGPDTDWTGLVFFVVGILILRGTERLSVNTGLGDALSLDVELPGRNGAGSKTSAEVLAQAKTTPDAWRNGRAPSALLFHGGGDDDTAWPIGSSGWPEAGGAGSGDSGRRRRCPRWVMTAAELTGVVFAWTGVEWYIWDDDYIPDSWLRDLAYTAIGLVILMLTGTFFNLAGVISPMAVLKQVHEHNRHEETTPLLSATASLDGDAQGL